MPAAMSTMGAQGLASKSTFQKEQSSLGKPALSLGQENHQECLEHPVVPERKGSAQG